MEEEKVIYMLFYNHSFKDGKVKKSNFIPLFISMEREKVLEKIKELPRRNNHYIIEHFPIDEDLFELDNNKVPFMKLFFHEHFESDEEMKMDAED